MALARTAPRTGAPWGQSVEVAGGCNTSPATRELRCGGVRRGSVPPIGEAGRLGPAETDTPPRPRSQRAERPRGALPSVAILSRHPRLPAHKSSRTERPGGVPAAGGTRPSPAPLHRGPPPSNVVRHRAPRGAPISAPPPAGPGTRPLARAGPAASRALWRPGLAS